MSQAKITLIGLEGYLNPEQSVFDKMVLPEGIDKDTLIGSILMRCQEFELLYSDPHFMQDAVSIWSRKNYRTFDKWVKALDIEYDPLFNYDRTEEYTDTHTGDFSKSGSGTSSNSSDYTRTDNLSQADDHTRTDNLSQADDHTRTDNLTTTNTHSEKAYNNTNFVESEKNVNADTGTQRQAGTVTNSGTQRNAGTITNTGTQRNAGSDNGTMSNSENGTDAYTNIHKARLFGNIGVVSSQDMLRQELSVAEWNLYEHIADLFCQEFCVMVY